MPTVPRYSQPQVSTAPRPGVRIAPGSPEAFMPVAPVDISGAAGVVRSIVQIERQKADEIAFTEADAQLAAEETRLLYDPKDGALTRRGKNAFSAPEEVRAAWIKRAAEIEGTLSTDRQRQAFRRSVLARGNDLDRRVQSHVGTEIQKHDEATTLSFIKNEQEAAIAAHLDEERVGQSLDRQRAAIRMFAKRTGKDAAETNQLVNAAVSQTHVGILNRMLATEEDRLASAYYEKFKGDILGSDKAKIEQALEEGSLRGESQRRSDIIVAEHATRSDAMAAARAIAGDPKLRDAVVQRVASRFDEQERIENEVQEDLYLKGTNLIDANPGRRARHVIPAGDWAQLSLPMRNALEARASGGPTENDNKAWLTFLALEPEEMGKLTKAQFESQYWSRFDQSHRGRAESLWLSARDSLTRGAVRSPELSATLTFRDRLDNSIRALGYIDPNKPASKFSDEEALLYAGIEKEVAARIEEFELSQLGGKRRATGTEIQERIDEVLINKVFIDRNWSLKVDVSPAALVTIDQQGRAFVPIDKIPPSKKQELERLMRSNGVRISNSRLEKAYAAYLMQNAALLRSLTEDK